MTKQRLMDKPKLETLSYKPTIAELEKAIGTPDEMDILPNGDVRPKYPNICSKQPTKSSRATKEKITPIIEPKTKVENSKVASQPLPRCKTCKDTGRRANKVGDSISFDNCPDCPEQPNTELLIVKTIQGLTTCINDNLVKLGEISEDMNYKALVLKALVDINLFDKIMLELQKAFE